jgi:colanic acid/amylovoran biosynthesis glycosyltransferase
MNLVIFTNFFPYKRSEPFLVNEFEYTEKYCSTITGLALYGKNEDTILTDKSNQLFLEPIFKAPGSKKKIFIKGLFNLAPFHFHLKYFFSIIASPKKIYWLFISLLITRAALSSKAYRQLTEIIKRSEKTILYFYWGDNLCWIIPYLAKKNKNKNLKIIIRLHGSDLYEHLKGGSAPLRNLIFSYADQIFPVSENGKKYLLEKYPEMSEKIIVSRLGVFDNGLNPHMKRDYFTIVSVSNMVELKRLPLIFEALQKMKSTVEWYHFGDGPLANGLKELVKTSRRDLSVHFKGHVDNKQLIGFYKTQPVDLFLNVSSTEGLPVSIMEALSFGIPVIAPDIGGISELVSAKTGMLIKADFNTDYLASLMEDLLKSDSIEELRRSARLIFEEKVSAEKNYNTFYKTLLSL